MPNTGKSSDPLRDSNAAKWQEALRQRGNEARGGETLRQMSSANRWVLLVTSNQSSIAVVVAVAVAVAVTVATAAAANLSAICHQQKEVQQKKKKKRCNDYKL